MKRIYFTLTFNLLALVCLIALLFFNYPSWAQIMGIIIMIAWIGLYPIIPKKEAKKKEPPK